ncbi:winged helix-turn-helix domain-containing protein [Acuticoccus mangrovi]|uniref:Winged helix-turn-helix domain-containing protein n=1 Tax=Acuticoccus mangrovi TaxID=2796142 RepID=A0A934IHA2_9HYPH|nr:winged helix-turn-helix domain-containing protein [Acuticoccus mangrovi]MBJ3776689.1 winged helix-turn-helix domain-containing protein [Acuticoccus mangrovi]
MSDTAPPGLRLRLIFGEDAMIGPGKADLLELVKETGSISAAGRRMGMSYRRAWGLIDTLNTIFGAPLVERTRGGASGGGATLTDRGEKVLAHYRSLEARARAAGAEDIAAIEAMLDASPTVMSGEK